MTPWKFTDATRRIVSRTRDDNSMESCVADREDVLAWVAKGNVIAEPDPVVPTRDEVQEAEAVGFGPLRTLAGMTQAQIDSHIDATFPAWTAPQRQVVKILARVAAIYLRREFASRLG